MGGVEKGHPALGGAGRDVGKWVNGGVSELIGLNRVFCTE